MDHDDDFVQNPSDQDNPLPDMEKVDRIGSDEDPPFSLPYDVDDRLGDDPLTDSEMDLHEEYDAGRETASGADFPVGESEENSEKIA